MNSTNPYHQCVPCPKCDAPVHPEKYRDHRAYNCTPGLHQPPHSDYLNKFVPKEHNWRELWDGDRKSTFFEGYKDRRLDRVEELSDRLDHEHQLLSLLKSEYLYLKELGVTSGQYKVKTDKGIEITITLSIA